MDTLQSSATTSATVEHALPPLRERMLWGIYDALFDKMVTPIKDSEVLTESQRADLLRLLQDARDKNFTAQMDTIQAPPPTQRLTVKFIQERDELLDAFFNARRALLARVHDLENAGIEVPPLDADLFPTCFLCSRGACADPCDHA